MTDGQIEEAAHLFAALAEPARLRIIQALLGEDLTVSELIEVTGYRQANASKHLSILLRAGLLRRSKEGTFVRYSVSDPFLKKLCSMVCGRMEHHAEERLRALCS